MALMQLVCVGAQNSYLPQNLVTEYFTEYFTNNNLVMEKSCETKCPEYLVIELDSNIDIVNSVNFKNICHKVCFEMEICGFNIINIPLRFMMLLKEYEICDGKFYISIPFQMFCDDIILISLLFDQVKFRLTNTENNFASCKLISRGVFYDTEIRRHMATNVHKHIIQFLVSTEINCLNQNNKFKYMIPMILFESICKGFFIECENIDEINEIKLILNNQVKSNYNRFLVRTKCVKINQHLLYFPFNYDKSYTDRTPSGFEGSLNLTNIDTSYLIIKLDNPQSKLCIYTLGSNLLKYTADANGVVLHFDYNFNLHNYEEYNENGIYNGIYNESQQTQTQTQIQP